MRVFEGRAWEPGANAPRNAGPSNAWIRREYKNEVEGWYR